MGKERLDKVLTQKKALRSRSQAEDLIRRGKVRVNGVIILKPGAPVDEDAELQILEETDRVGRGGLKLEGLLRELKLSVEGFTVADIGSSTGGFTEVLLKAGAQKVYAVDVGTGQLATTLKNDSRVINLENHDVREENLLPEIVDLVVADVSFISLRLILEPILNLRKPGAPVLILFKPQFEAGPEFKGMVPRQYTEEKLLPEIQKLLAEKNLSARIFPCELPGKMGNQEFWLAF